MLRQMKLRMKTKFNIFSRFGIIGLTISSLCFAGGAMAQTESKKKSDAAVNSEVATTKEKPSSAQRSSLGEKDKTFLKKAAKGGMMEVAMGKLASEQGQSADVKKFGERMVTDHSKANDQLKSIAAKKGVKLPSKKLSEKWKSDKDYMDAMVKDHEKDLAEFQEEAKEGTDPDLKEFAETTAKVIQEHLDLAKETQSKLQ
jgi:putative membrane protein